MHSPLPSEHRYPERAAPHRPVRGRPQAGARLLGRRAILLGAGARIQGARVFRARSGRRIAARPISIVALTPARVSARSSACPSELPAVEPRAGRNPSRMFLAACGIERIAQRQNDIGVLGPDTGRRNERRSRAAVLVTCGAEYVVHDQRGRNAVLTELLAQGQIEIAIGLFPTLRQYRRADGIGIELYSGRGSERELVDQSQRVARVGSVLAPLVTADELIIENNRINRRIKRI